MEESSHVHPLNVQPHNVFFALMFLKVKWFQASCSVTSHFATKTEIKQKQHRSRVNSVFFAFPCWILMNKYREVQLGVFPPSGAGGIPAITNKCCSLFFFFTCIYQHQMGIKLQTINPEKWGKVEYKKPNKKNILFWYIFVILYLQSCSCYGPISRPPAFHSQPQVDHQPDKGHWWWFTSFTQGLPGAP